MLHQPVARLFVAIILFGCMWFYVQRILIPHQQLEAVVTGRPRGMLSDLYPRWLGTRELLLHHRDPYSAEVTREIQAGYYGRALDASRPEDPKDQQAFAYPVFVVFLLAPTVSLPFEAIKTAFTWLLVFLTASTIPLWLRVVGWRVPWTDQLTMIVLTLGSFQVAQGLKLQQLSLAVSALLAAAVALATAGQLLTAGACLALALIKPQLTLALLAWLLVWATGDFRNRWRLVAGFTVAAALLFAGAQIILPGWTSKFHAAIVSYRQYTGGAESLPEMLLGIFVGRLVEIFLILACAVLGWIFRHKTQGSQEFSLVTALVLSVTVVIVPMVALYNQVLLIPAVLLLVHSRERLRLTGRLTRTLALLTLLWGIWPWVATGLLALASIGFKTSALLKLWFLPLHSTLTLPILVTALMLLRALDATRRAETPAASRARE
jgi:hypothetical protein